MNNPITDQVLAAKYHKAFQVMEATGGGFCAALAAAWFKADLHHKTKIEWAFPELIAKFLRLVDYAQKEAA